MSASLMDKLRNLDKATVKARCASYLTGAEINALFERRAEILELYARLVAEKGEFGDVSVRIQASPSSSGV